MPVTRPEDTPYGFPLADIEDGAFGAHAQHLPHVEGHGWSPSDVVADGTAPRSPWAKVIAIGTLGAFSAGAALVGTGSTMSSVNTWYRGLDKPPFNPPSWVFGPVWSGLYVLMTISAYRVWKQPRSRARTVALALWGTQLALNAAWSPLFFGFRRPAAALGDLLLLGGAVAAYAAVARKVDRPAAYMMIPYLGWLGFAGLLNEEIVRLNPEEAF